MGWVGLAPLRFLTDVALFALADLERLLNGSWTILERFLKAFSWTILEAEFLSHSWRVPERFLNDSCSRFLVAIPERFLNDSSTMTGRLLKAFSWTILGAEFLSHSWRVPARFLGDSWANFWRVRWRRIVERVLEEVSWAISEGGFLNNSWSRFLVTYLKSSWAILEGILSDFWRISEGSVEGGSLKEVS